MPFFLFVVGVSISLVFKCSPFVLFCRMVAFWLYGLYDPDLEFEVPSTHLFGYKSGSKIANCGVKGSLEAPCNAVGLIDQFFFLQCSVNSPDYRPLVPDSPVLISFLRNLLSFLMASITCFLGLQFGHILVHFKGHMQRLYLWLACSFTVHYWISVKTSWCSFLLTIIYFELCVHYGGSIRLGFNDYLLHSKSQINGFVSSFSREAIRREREREMATEKADVEVSDTNNDGIQNTSTETSVNSETPTSAVPRFGKALAHRALYGSSSRHGGSRKARSSDVKTLPSRLSKVSVADDTENRE
ncbi:hypothetical protein POTOM_010782 [Populus tomentosa]|uniref:Uncharacterized protein n=1 Tax=Populus tomentosa TaxID=118781 RepID=A0A8X8DCQ3_POPTO|nr:hypothetical protein POTOM_010782 [Populus tomentosa]